MFERILLPLDGSELAKLSIAYGEELASKFNSEIILYHVKERDQEQSEHMRQSYLDRLAEIIRPPNSKSGGFKVTTKIEEGESAENICNLVDRNKIDLIIMTAVSVSGLKIGKMMGSVTDHVCHTVPIPVMLIRPKTAKREGGKQNLITNILIPFDGSELSKLAIPIGRKLAGTLKIPITLFEMAPRIRPYATYGGYAAIIDFTEADEQEKKRAKEEMAVLDKELKQEGLEVTSIVTLGFDAATEIEKACKNIGADLVVMSTRGRSGLDRWIMGSVAKRFFGMEKFHCYW